MDIYLFLDHINTSGKWIRSVRSKLMVYDPKNKVYRESWSAPSAYSMNELARLKVRRI
jgi:hypothetical protein